MADVKITGLSALAAPAVADLVEVVDDVAGTPTSKKATLGNVLSLVWPIGSIFISAVETSPETLLGFGTWEAFGAGRVLVGIDANDTDFDTLEETRGAKTVAASGAVSQPTFTGNAITDVINHTHAVSITDPGHTHVETNNSATTGGTVGWGARDTSTNNQTATGYSTESATTGITASTANPAGGVASITPTGTVSQPTFTGSATSVVQPSIVVSMWKRTA